MKKLVFFLVLMAALPMVMFGQYRVEGKVTREDGSALPGARVQLQGKTVATSADGNYLFENVSAGVHLLQVNFVGFAPNNQNIEVNRNTVVDVTLFETSIMTHEVTVAAIRAKRNDPVAFSEVTSADIAKVNFGQDIPYLLNMTPGLVVSSDAGAGVGYTSMRLRGTDITRINVTVNGIPLNDAESQGVYWVNMPDFATSVSEVQVQRGVGTSTNGAAAFGGSINMSTFNKPGEGSVIIDNSFGSFNTQRNSVQVQSGLMPNNFAFDVRLSKISSDGFVDRGASDLKSFYFSSGYYGNATTLRFVTFSGKEKTYQTWNGVPKVKLNNDQAGMEKLVMMDGWSDEEANNLYQSDARTFNRYLYKNQTDNYQQNHYQLHLSHRFSPRFFLTGAAHYTHGKGYYESYKYNQKFTKYNFPFAEVVVDGVTVKRTDLVARKWLDNDFYGFTTSGVYKSNSVSLVLGSAWNRYDGDHFGNVIWSAVNAGLPVNYRWYENFGKKTDFNYFAKLNVDIITNLSLYGDLQMRHVSYKIKGIHDNGKDLSRSTKFNFFNPKAGFSYTFSPGSRVYASVAVANREPSRSDFRDADPGKEPKKEKLIDYEAGIDWAGKTWTVQLNGFYMNYKNQLVLTGKINNVGAPIMENVGKSYRAGVELAAQANITSRLIWGGNVVISSNKINRFTEYVDVWDDGTQQATYLGTTDIAFSPGLTFVNRLEYMPVTNLMAGLNTRYVGKQYIDNTSNKERQLDAYLVNDLVLRYQIKSKKGVAIELGAQINNLLNEQYISNAWVYSYYSEGVRDVLDGYFPQAGRHYMGQVVVRF